MGGGEQTQIPLEPMFFLVRLMRMEDDSLVEDFGKQDYEGKHTKEQGESNAICRHLSNQCFS